MNSDKFLKLAQSLRQYRRADLSDFQGDVNGNPLDLLYVDPLASDAVLKTVTQNNTTFLIGRKGTGKSTVFAKAQAELRKRPDGISVYIDVKSLHEVLSTQDVVVYKIDDASISPEVLMAHRLRKTFLATVISQLIIEIQKVYEGQSLIERWTSKWRGYGDIIAELINLADEITQGGLTDEELPILKVITAKSKNAFAKASSLTASASSESKLNLVPQINISGSLQTFDENVSDNELYQEYADVILRSFPFNNLLLKIQELLAGAGLKRLFVFFDDFSELTFLDQKLFVDVILAPLNNASNESIKLKIAGYPGRIYYGKIDPGKIDTLGLDFYQIYKSSDIQTSEASAIEYLQRLLKARFVAFGAKIDDYFEEANDLSEYYRLIFEITLNVPRSIGYVLHNCYLDKISKGQKITLQSLRLSAQKHYESILSKYFDRLNRFAMEPFERKLDRHNQNELLKSVIQETRSVRRRISSGDIGGRYFEGLSNPPASHYAVSPSLEAVFSPLELNFLVTKYHEMRDKDGQDVCVFAISYGLCESERIPWGYPKGRRDDRSYFVQRCFNYTALVKTFLSQNQTVRCKECGASFGMEKKDNIEFYKWKCPECQAGVCAVVSLGEDFAEEIKALDKDIMLPALELEILETLNEEKLALRANEIAQLIDTTYQMVGRRTSKLKDMGLVDKREVDGAKKSSITEKAKDTYFSS